MKQPILTALVLAACVACGDTDTPNDQAAGGGDAAGGAGGANAGSGGSAELGEPALPTPTGACPDFVAGDVTFAPAGIPARTVRLFLDEEAVAAQDGPLVFYWHGTGSSPLAEPPYGMGEAQTWVLEAGGVIAAPHSDPSSGTWPWFLTAGGDDESDLILADEILACAVEQVGIDAHHIHSMGMSAGGLNTTQMSYRRSGYLASVVTYSGGILGDIPVQNEDNPFAAMIFHGGVNDEVVVNFKDLSEKYLNDLRERGHYGFICDHGGGHTIPKGNGEQAAVAAFLRDHPWNTTPSPYESGLPEDFPDYCVP
jgi:predicted esterase